ncbi:hypothetical protein [Neisseria montereyensis]|uniref:Uncharacterized protein n=1 Tax=Neisseria montereyensis TaxID=2973938 RepID=A0ABT2FE53_9NEIS|nr:hypothetical protein [Neisseria montereyensis]MCS4534499.1 hypothetical protein [Neisseria montereyensis]
MTNNFKIIKKGRLKYALGGTIKKIDEKECKPAETACLHYETNINKYIQ